MYRSSLPCFGRISDIKARSPLGRSSLYELAQKHPGLFKKFGAVTVVDFALHDKILAALPPADIGAKAAGEANAEPSKNLNSESPGPGR